MSLPSQRDHIESLEEDIKLCKIEHLQLAQKLHPHERVEYERGIRAGVKWESRPAQNSRFVIDLKRLWNLLLVIRDNCKTRKQAFCFLYGVNSEAVENSDEITYKSFQRFQKLCHRLGLRMRGRSRQTKPKNSSERT